MSENRNELVIEKSETNSSTEESNLFISNRTRKLLLASSVLMGAAGAVSGFFAAAEVGLGIPEGAVAFGLVSAGQFAASGLYLKASKS